jgi:ABC-type transport system involved in cytochrome bd biosynthesis fused ATPase/permease subunit
MMQATGRINVRGQNGSGKSSLLLALRKQLKGQAYYWPTADRLAFKFSQTEDDLDTDDDESASGPRGYSSGEQQITALEEIVNQTNAAVYLLDEWDANLDGANRAKAQELITRLAQRARVIEISHRDPV